MPAQVRITIWTDAPTVSASTAADVANEAVKVLKRATVEANVAAAETRASSVTDDELTAIRTVGSTGRSAVDILLMAVRDTGLTKAQCITALGGTP